MFAVRRGESSVFGALRKYSEVTFSKKLKSPAFRILDGKFDVGAPRHQEALDKNAIASELYQKFKVQVRSGGGEKAIYRHTKVRGKLLVYDRLKLLLDEGSDVFTIGEFAGLGMDYGDILSGGGVSLIGKINGQYCVVMANNATVKGGTAYPVGVVKQIRTQNIANRNRLPTVCLVDSGGAYLPLQSEIFPDKLHGGRVFRNITVMEAHHVPQIAVVCGSCTAGGAYIPVLSQECIMVKNIGFIYLGGPPLVKAATGEDATDESLGGTEVHCRFSGCADHYAENEKEAFDLCREVIQTLNLPQMKFSESYKPPLNSESELRNFAGLIDVSKDDIFNILSRVLDESKFKEFKAEFGSNLITGFGYIGG